jgi:transmembrane sensor
MTEAWLKAEDARRTAAADWVVRLQSPDLDEADALAFDAWLGSDANARAYDAALAVMLDIEAAAPLIAQGLHALPGPTAKRRISGRGWIVAGGLAAAATVALAVTPFGALVPAASHSFATAKGEHRTVRLEDGTTIDLNAASRLTVALGRHERRVDMPQGEAVFDVAADNNRPFLIAAGDRTVRVVGTRFDVRRRGNQLSVTVERGLVEVVPNAGGQGRAFRLHPGQRLDHADGGSDVRISAAAPAEVFSWRTGRLIYRDQPLREVIADLNEQFARPILIEDPTLADARISGVLVLDDQAAVIRRLALLVPITSLPSARGIELRRDVAVKP